MSSLNNVALNATLNVFLLYATSWIISSTLFLVAELFISSRGKIAYGTSG